MLEIKINIPEELTDSLALDLLIQPLPKEWTCSDIEELDFKGKEAVIERKNCKEGFVYKAVAAMGYEWYDDTQQAAYCYNRASRNALELKLPLASLVCAGKALSIYPYLMPEEDETEIGQRERNRRELFIYLPLKILEAAGLETTRFMLSRYNLFYQERNHEQTPSHSWFTHSYQPVTT